MLADIIKDPRFVVLFNFIVGFGLASLFRPLCKSEGGTQQCHDFKTPNVKEMNDHVYRLGAKCYKFTSSTMECPSTGKIIEPFRNVLL